MTTRYWVTGGTGLWASTTNWSAISGGANGASFPVAGDTANFDASSGSGTATVSVSNACGDLNFAGFTGTFAGSSSLAVGGSLTLGSGMTWTYSGTMTFGATSGTKTITCAGKTLACPLVFDGTGGTFQIADTFRSTAGMTLTRGTLDLNSQTGTSLFIQSLLAHAPTLALGNAQWTLTQAGNKALQTDGGVIITKGGSSKFIFAMSSASGGGISVSGQSLDDISITGPGAWEVFGTLICRDILASASASSSQIQLHAASVTARTLDFTGFGTGVLDIQTGVTLSGNLKLVSGMTTTTSGIGAVTLNGTGAQTVTTGGVVVTFPLHVNVTGAPVITFADAFVSTAAVDCLSSGATFVGLSGAVNSSRSFNHSPGPDTSFTLSASTPGSPTFWNVTYGDQRVGNTFVSDWHVGGGARWFAPLSSDDGGNYGWRFTDIYRSPVIAA